MKPGYLVDTDWVIEYLHDNPVVVQRLQRLDAGQMAVSPITLAEVYEGVYGSVDPAGSEAGFRKFLTRVTIVGIDDETCQLFGKERGRLRAAKTLIDDFDLLIGATALRHGLTLLTNNRKHFARIKNLVLESA